MKTFKTYLAEATDPSTYFEGVIVDCWNEYTTGEDKFKGNILKKPNTVQFLISAKRDKKWATTNKDENAQRDVLWHFAKLLNKKLSKASGNADKAGQTKPGVSDTWTEITNKKKDTSKTDIQIGTNDLISVKGPKAQLMSGEQKESKATVVSAIQASKAPEDIREKLLGVVDEFITSTRTYGAESQELPKGMTVGALTKLGKSGAENLPHAKENLAAFEKISKQKDLKVKTESIFKEAFKNTDVSQAFAWEAMTGWEKFGGKAFNDAGSGREGEANKMLVWNYDMRGVKYYDLQQGGSFTKDVANKMSMKADFKSSRWEIKGVKQGYSFFQTVRLSVNAVFDRSDELEEEYKSIVLENMKLLTENRITEGKFTDVVSKAWTWVKDKMLKVWNWATEQFIKLKNTMIELFDKGIHYAMQFFEIDVTVNVNSTIRL